MYDTPLESYVKMRKNEPKMDFVAQTVDDLCHFEKNGQFADVII